MQQPLAVKNMPVKVVIATENSHDAPMGEKGSAKLLTAQSCLWQNFLKFSSFCLCLSETAAMKMHLLNFFNTLPLLNSCGVQAPGSQAVAVVEATEKSLFTISVNSCALSLSGPPSWGLR